MSFVITLYVREGIVMAVDSRMTLLLTEEREGPQPVRTAVGQSDSTQKLFLTPTRIGIAAYGAADVAGVPIAGFMESFINEQLSQGDYAVHEVARELLTYFRNLPQPPDAGFLVAGYEVVENIPEQHVWQVIVSGNSIERVNEPGQQGAIWRGETDILSRLVLTVGLQDGDGNFQPQPHFQIQWGYFTLQDAVDYCMYAVKVTIDTMRFHPRPKTVGGPIDVLFIKPNEASWVQEKKLHA